MSLRAIAVAALGLCVAGLAFVFTSVRDPAAVAAARSSAALPSPGTTAARAWAPFPPGGENRAAPTPWSRSDPASVVAERWHAARDKREFFDHALRTGGGAYLHFAGKALAACGAVNRLGVIGAEQRFGATHGANDPTLTRRIESFRASIGGCDGFEARPVAAEEEAQIYQRLLASADIVGRIYAYKLWALSAARNDEARATLAQALDSRDPELLALVYPALVAREFAEQAPGAKVSEDMQDELDAWRWALCELGTDCRPASAYGRSLCANHGLCEWQAIDDVAERMFAGATRSRKDEIVASVLAGDWSKLGL